MLFFNKICFSALSRHAANHCLDTQNPQQFTTAKASTPPHLYIIHTTPTIIITQDHHLEPRPSDLNFLPQPAMASYSMGFLIAIVVCACALSTLAARDLADDSAIVVRHEQWMTKYGRVYSDAAEKARRLEVFKANMAFIELVNARNDKFWLEANQFADITNDEFRATHTGFKLPLGGSKGRRMTSFRYANVSLDALPTALDWRTKGAVTPIKDQGQCGKLKFILSLNFAQFACHLNDWNF